MRTVIQRVSHAEVVIDGKTHGAIQKGFMILVGIEDNDTEEIVKKVADKISKLRIFTDDEDKMNLDLRQVDGAILSISQFTLYADCHKGNRPSFSKAGKPDYANKLYMYFNEYMRQLGFTVEEGIFGADMKVTLLNDGPVTILLDSDDLK